MAAIDRMDRLARSRSFSADTSEVRRARRFVADVLTELGSAELVPDAELAVSELFGNAVRHAAGATVVDVRVSTTDRTVRVEVVDDGTPPDHELQIGSPVPEDPTGRGLMVVGILASRWGAEPTGAGTSVWFELAR